MAIGVLSASAVGSPMLRTRGPLLLHRPAEAWFDVDPMAKDVDLALEQGRNLHVPLPSTAIASNLLTSAQTLGYGDQDIVAMFDVLAQPAGFDRAAA